MSSLFISCARQLVPYMGLAFSSKDRWDIAYSLRLLGQGKHKLIQSVCLR